MAKPELLAQAQEACHQFLADPSLTHQSLLRNRLAACAWEEQAVADVKQQAIDAARNRYTDSSCDIEIDDTADVSVGDDGLFVSGWLWVSFEDLGPGGDAE